MRRKTRVLSVRLKLDALQSCFDLCEMLGHPTNGASGAIARSIETLTADLRNKAVIPTYTDSELEHLVAAFIASRNPTSMASLEGISMFEESSSIVEIKKPACCKPLTNEDFAPSILAVEEGEVDEAFELSEQTEYEELIEERIREVQREEEDELLRKITLG